MRCQSCEQDHPEDHFPQDTSRPSGRHPYCKPCKAAKMREAAARRTEAAAQAIERRCSACGELKPRAEFTPKGWKCLDCKQTTADLDRERRCLRHRQTYDRRKEQRSRRLADLRDRRKMEIIKRIGGRCEDCGIEPGNEWPVAVFDFHHRDPEAKEAAVSALINRGHIEAALKEVERCAVLCSNCHRRHHWRHKRGL